MTFAKPRTVTLTGTPSPEDGGEYLIVDRAMFVEAAGREPRRDEQIAKGKYTLYWRDTSALLRGKRKVRVKLTVTPV